MLNKWVGFAGVRIVCKKFDVDVMMRSGRELQMRASSLVLLRMACCESRCSIMQSRCSSAGMPCCLLAYGAADTLLHNARSITSNNVFNQFAILFFSIVAKLMQKKESAKLLNRRLLCTFCLSFPFLILISWLYCCNALPIFRKQTTCFCSASYKNKRVAPIGRLYYILI